MAAFLLGYGLNPNEGNQITSSTTKHSYEENQLQPDFGDGSGMVMVTISGLN